MHNARISLDEILKLFMWYLQRFCFSLNRVNTIWQKEKLNRSKRRERKKTNTKHYLYECIHLILHCTYVAYCPGDKDNEVEQNNKICITKAIQRMANGEWLLCLYNHLFRRMEKRERQQWSEKKTGSDIVCMQSEMIQNE